MTSAQARRLSRRRTGCLGRRTRPARRFGRRLSPESGLLFGVAAGVFLHVAVDLLPECSTGSETCPVDGADREGDRHRLRDRFRRHAVLSSVFGGTAVAVAWWVAV
ncbi:hypothetical protein C464_04668 [Halorubrum coriense DSM 10284]|uniref:Uncharacterized protein n=1 Tax=Halorubrum coriense DSM 10284 TaxID=1227466 RepID=M0EQJ0_9EURY|nr:hypothetical protein [Halorubrum coriense]ELZ49358.1 hypothetical protein C464_04668 [Halorubrum coriense DSM 10284]